MGRQADTIQMHCCLKAGYTQILQSSHELERTHSAWKSSELNLERCCTAHLLNCIAQCRSNDWDNNKYEAWGHRACTLVFTRCLIAATWRLLFVTYPVYLDVSSKTNFLTVSLFNTFATATCPTKSVVSKVRGAYRCLKGRRLVDDDDILTRLTLLPKIYFYLAFAPSSQTFKLIKNM